MQWLENLRKKSQQEKIRLIWIVAIVAAVILIVLWILTSRIAQSLPKDTSLFQSIKQEFKVVRDSLTK